MARPHRFEYPGAVYHVMARGDGGKRIFIGQEDHESFLYWLERVCGSHGWRVHAWVLMGNHFHLLLETPEANLSAGMRVLLGTFSQAWNIRHQRRGHVFQGRYKAVPVAGERVQDAHYFKSVADYIHLNPARAGLAGGRRGVLAGYPWSSLRHYAKGDAPEWQPLDRVLDAFRLSHERRGRAAYLDWLETRAAHDGGRIDEKSMQPLRRGWYLGEESFKAKLLGLRFERCLELFPNGPFIRPHVAFQLFGFPHHPFPCSLMTRRCAVFTRRNWNLSCRRAIRFRWRNSALPRTCC
jgi:REP element-mobilizing transposase RayT